MMTAMITPMTKPPLTAIPNAMAPRMIATSAIAIPRMIESMM